MKIYFYKKPMIFAINEYKLIIVNPETNIKVEVDISKNTKAKNFDYYEVIEKEFAKTLNIVFPKMTNRIFDVSEFTDDCMWLSPYSKSMDETCVNYDDIVKMATPNKHTLHIWTKDYEAPIFVSLISEEDGFWLEWLDKLNPIQYKDNLNLLRVMISSGVCAKEAMDYLIDSIEYISDTEENEDTNEEEFIDYMESIMDLLKSSNHPEAQYILGYYYDLIGNSDAAKKYWGISSNKIAYSKYCLGCICQDEKDYEGAISHWKQSVEMDNKLPEAHYDLGLVYYRGIRAPKDFKKSFYHFQKAAEVGYSRAYYYMGMAYAHAEGVPQIDDERALYYYNRAVAFSPSAKQRYSALYSIGYFYDNGVGGLAKDENMAVAIYEMCLEENDCVDSAMNLGEIYKARSEYKKAQEYFEIAAESPYYENDAETALEELYLITRATKYRFSDDGIVLQSLYDKVFKWYMPHEIISVDASDDNVVWINDRDTFTFATREDAEKFYVDAMSYFNISEDKEHGLLEKDKECFYYIVDDYHFIIVDWSNPNDVEVEDDRMIVSGADNSWIYTLPSEDMATEVFEYFCSLAF